MLTLQSCVSWALGRPGSSPSTHRLPKGNQLANANPSRNDAELDFSELERELHEIGNQIQLAQTESKNTLAARLGLPQAYGGNEYHTLAVQLDSSLNRWEDELPQKWKLDYVHRILERGAMAKVYLLHIRSVNALQGCQSLLLTMCLQFLSTNTKEKKDSCITEHSSIVQCWLASAPGK